MSGATMTAEARVDASWGRYLGLARNAIAPGPADSRVATRDISTAASPCSVAPTRWASSASEIGTERTMSRDAGGRAPSASGALPLLVGERLDHLFRDVD